MNERTYPTKSRMTGHATYVHDSTNIKHIPRYAVCTLEPLIAIDKFQPRLEWQLATGVYAYRLIRGGGGGGGGGGAAAELQRYRALVSD